MKPADALAALDALSARGIHMRLDAMNALLAELGDPHAAFAWVHVAGTNGKGSVAAMCEAALREAGHATALYTSPHLVRLGERIRIGGRDVDDAELAAGVARILPAVRAVDATHDGVTYFEAVTALAFDLFSRAGVEIAVVEVGLGGRLDATNVHPAPLVTVVTNVGRDHADLLGSDPAAVAREKAAIFRPGVPAVTAANGPALEAIVAHAAAVGAPLRALGRDFVLDAGTGTGKDDGGASLQRFRVDGEDFATNLEGAHQATNAALAVEALRAVDAAGYRVPVDAVRRGLASVRWRGRLEWLPGRPRVLLDGAHNPDGVDALLAYLKGGGLRPVLLFGVLADKAWGEMIPPLAEGVAAAVVTRPPSPRALAPMDAAREFSRAGVVATVVDDPAHALATAEAQAGPDGVVLVTGSLYLVGEVLRMRGKA